MPIGHFLQLVAAVLAQLERFLQREAVMPSFRCVVGAAALGALARLTAHLRGPAARCDRCAPDQAAGCSVAHHMPYHNAEILYFSFAEAVQSP